MTDEVKTCDCKEKALKKLADFCFIAGAVFIGVLLAILLSVNILKPKCPPCPGGMYSVYPRMERPLPPPPPRMHHNYVNMEHYRGPHYGAPDINGDRPGSRAFENRRAKHHLKYQKNVIKEADKPAK